MSESALLSLVVRYPHPTALARRARNGYVFAALRRLESRGLVRRQRGLYRVTARGRSELALTWSVTRLLARSLP
jgi:DNA-binding PadR family transcriptional regulator